MEAAMKRSTNFDGLVAVVTGSASGIGAETARQLHTRGASILMADIQFKDDSIDESPNAGGRNTIRNHCDVSKLESWEELSSVAISEFGKVDILINCAGITTPGMIEDLSEREIMHQVEVNLLGTFWGTRVFLPYFKQRGHGHLIHIASLGGIAPLPHESVYSATKFAIRGFCLSLALELEGSGVNVSVVCPDSVETPQLMHEAANNGSPLSFTSKFLKPADVATAILRTIARPKAEVLVTPLRGLASKIANFSPSIIHLAYPMMKKSGEKNLRKYLSRLPQTDNQKELLP
jgi:short-subunit dehydrogenase